MDCPFPGHPVAIEVVPADLRGIPRVDPWIHETIFDKQKKISGWWFQPPWKILVNWDDYSQLCGKIKNVPTHQPGICSLKKWYDVFPPIKSGGIPTPLNNMKVSWDDDIPNRSKNTSHVPNIPEMDYHAAGQLKPQLLIVLEWIPP